MSVNLTYEVNNPQKKVIPLSFEYNKDMRDMKKFVMLLVMMVATIAAMAQQEGKEVAVALPHKVTDLTLIDLRGKPANLPYYGEKNLLIFYVDPDKHKQNEEFVYDMEYNHRAAGENIEGFGIINLKDTMFPNGIVRMLARKRTEKNGATIVADTDHIVAEKWGLGDCNNMFVLMIVSKEGELVFCRKGEFTEQDKADFYEIVEKYR